jgi:hypothetical protein
MPEDHDPTAESADARIERITQAYRAEVLRNRDLSQKLAALNDAYVDLIANHMALLKELIRLEEETRDATLIEG